jgi:hypothetical protein
MSRAAFVRAMASMPSFRNLMSAYIHASGSIRDVRPLNAEHFGEKALGDQQLERAGPPAGHDT